MNRFEKIWLSSEEHLEKFKIIRKEGHLVSKSLNLDKNDDFYDFPRVSIASRRTGGRTFPVVFQDIGQLVITEKDIQFYCPEIDSWNSVQPDNKSYYGINKRGNLLIQTAQIEKIDIIKPELSFFSYFDINWIRIIYNSGDLTKSILLSHSGRGFAMGKIRTKNMHLLQTVKGRMT